MAVYKRGDTYWYEFVFTGKRFREPAKTTSKIVAKEAEKARHRDLERTLAGLPTEKRKARVRSVSDMIRAYLHRMNSAIESSPSYLLRGGSLMLSVYSAAIITGPHRKCDPRLYAGSIEGAGEWAHSQYGGGRAEPGNW